MNHCKTCKTEIPVMGLTGKPKVFCSESCKLYFTNHVRHFDVLEAAKADAIICGDDESLLKEWATIYGVDGKGSFRRKIFEDKFGLATGLSNTTQKILSIISEHPGNDKLEKLSERFNAWVNDSKPEICPVCNEGQPSFNQTRWRVYCSEDCCNRAKASGGNVRQTIDSVMIEKYGVKGGFTKDRIEQFNDEREARTGFRHSTQTPEVKEKLLKSMSESGRFVSKPEREIREYFETVHSLRVITGAYNIIQGKQLDLFFPDQSIAVEYNGCFYHSEGNGGREFAKWRHVEKTELCEAKGIQLIHIWEDEWVASKDKVLKLLESKLGLVRPSIYARKTILVRNPNTFDLYSETHIQGHSSASIVYGLEHEGLLVAAMSFTKNRIPGIYEITRFATKGVVGAFGKLLNAFCDKNEWVEIYSFGDRCVVSRLSNVYLSNGFVEESISPPDYKYTSGKADRIHKFNFRKKLLSRKHGLDPTLTESQMVEILGFKRIYGCGLIRYTLKNTK